MDLWLTGIFMQSCCMWTLDELSFPHTSMYPTAAACRLKLHLATIRMCDDAHACLLWHSRLTRELELFQTSVDILNTSDAVLYFSGTDDKQRQVLRLGEALPAKTIKHPSLTAYFQRTLMTLVCGSFGHVHKQALTYLHVRHVARKIKEQDGKLSLVFYSSLM